MWIYQLQILQVCAMMRSILVNRPARINRAPQAGTSRGHPDTYDRLGTHLVHSLLYTFTYVCRGVQVFSRNWAFWHRNRKFFWAKQGVGVYGSGETGCPTPTDVTDALLVR